MPGKSTGLASKPRAHKATSGSKRFGSSIGKPADQRRIRIPVLGGGAQISKPRRRLPKKIALPGCLLSITLILTAIITSIFINIAL